jgi:hypothetical protein
LLVSGQYPGVAEERMLDKEAIVLIDVPHREDNAIYVNPVRGDLSPMDLLVLRMKVSCS